MALHGRCGNARGSDRRHLARTSVHLGSAGTFYALVAVQPERDLAVAVMTNAGGDRAEAASVSLARHLIGSQFD